MRPMTKIHLSSVYHSTDNFKNTFFLFSCCATVLHFLSILNIALFLFKVGHPPLYVTLSIRLSVCLSVHRALYLRNHTSSDYNFWYTYAKNTGVFSINFKILIFWAVRGVKGRGKRAKNSPK